MVRRIARDCSCVATFFARLVACSGESGGSIGSSSSGAPASALARCLMLAHPSGGAGRGASARSGVAATIGGAARPLRRGVVGPGLEHLTEHQQRRLEVAGRRRRAGRRRAAATISAAFPAATRGSNSTPERTNACFTSAAVRLSSSGTRSAATCSAAARTGAGIGSASRGALRDRLDIGKQRREAALLRGGGAHRLAERTLGRDDLRLLLRCCGGCARAGAIGGASRRTGASSGVLPGTPARGRLRRRARDDHGFADRMLAGQASAPPPARPAAAQRLRLRPAAHRRHRSPAAHSRPRP